MVFCVFVVGWGWGWGEGGFEVEAAYRHIVECFKRGFRVDV